MELSDEDRIARGRFFLLTLARLGGVIVLMLGVVIWKTDLIADGGLPALGIAMFVLGLAETLLLPRLLASKWRTPPGQ